MLKKFISFFTWLLFFLSFGITSVVAIAQDSLPGDKTYSIKKTFENVVLGLYKFANKETKYQIDLTKIRYKELKQTLNSQNAFTTIENFNTQMINTYQSIKKTGDSKTKTIYAHEFINTLKDINNELDYQKSTVNNNYPIATSAPNNNVIIPNNTVPPIASEINNTQEQINQIIRDLEQTTANSNSSENTTSTDLKDKLDNNLNSTINGSLTEENNLVPTTTIDLNRINRHNNLTLPTTVVPTENYNNDNKNNEELNTTNNSTDNNVDNTNIENNSTENISTK